MNDHLHKTLRRLAVTALTLSLLVSVSSLHAAKTGTHSIPAQQHGSVGFDQLQVKDIVVGFFDYEREMVQDLIVDMRVTIDLELVAQDDHLDATVDYVKLADLVDDEVRTGQYYALDSLAVATLQRTFDTYPEVEAASIRIHKPLAIPEADSGGILEVSLTREQTEQLSEGSDPIIAHIGFNNLYVHTVIGDLDIERENPQDLYFNARATIDLRPVLQQEELASTVDYQEMARVAQRVSDAGQYQMIETLAVNYLQALTEIYPQIREGNVQIRKPGTLPGYPFGTDAITELTILN